MPKRVAFYVRVSTSDGQTTENQLRQLHEVADRSGWIVTAVFRDDGISGAKGRDRRPGLNAMLKAVTRREVDLVAAWSVDRLGRSLPDLLHLLGELQARGVVSSCTSKPSTRARPPAGCCSRCWGSSPSSSER